MTTPNVFVGPWASSSAGPSTTLPEELDGLAPARGVLIGILLSLLAWGVAILLAFLWLR